MSSSMTDITELSDTQKIVVTLSEQDIAIEPGQSRQLEVTMHNQQEAPDRLSLEIEGIDVEWYSIPLAAVNVGAGEQASVRIPFKIGRNSENRAGTYPFLVRVQAMESGLVGVTQGTLIILPYKALQLELNPKRVTASYLARYNDLDVTVSNQGNTEETLDLSADDPEDGCIYEFATDRITLKPGLSEVVPLTVRPRAMTILGGVTLYGFRVTVRSAADAYVSATAHGQLEKRALISPLTGIFFLLLLAAGVGAWYFRPKPLPPLVIKAFDVTPKKVNANQDVTLTWDTSPKEGQVVLYKRVGADGVNVADPGVQPNAIGSLRVRPDAPPAGSPPHKVVYVLELRGAGHKKEVRKEVAVEVMPLPPSPKPVVRFFRADPPVIHAGESVMLSWEARGHREIILDPGNLRLSRYEQTRQVTLDQDTTFKLRALGDSETVEPAEKKVSVRVAPRDVCIAEIQSFLRSPETVYFGDKVRLSWRTLYAKSVRVESDRGFFRDGLSPSSSLSVEINEPTTFTLTAIDSAGQSVNKTLTVRPKVRPVEPEPEPVPSPTGETTPPATDNTGTQNPAPR